MSTKSHLQNSVRWIGLADVVPTPGNEILGAAKGAYVAVVADADGEDSFLRLITSELLRLGFVVKALDDVEPLPDRLAHQALPHEFAIAITEISPNAPVAIGAFHSYAE